ncbi:hypothetical protein C0J52_20563 [Blattella germanica]|nr:hypothetical protein C0J52_20563 [Blattella germanica]
MRRKVEVEGPEELHGMINNIPEDILFEAEAKYQKTSMKKNITNFVAELVRIRIFGYC